MYICKRYARESQRFATSVTTTGRWLQKTTACGNKRFGRELKGQTKPGHRKLQQRGLDASNVHCKAATSPLQINFVCTTALDCSVTQALQHKALTFLQEHLSIVLRDRALPIHILQFRLELAFLYGLGILTCMAHTLYPLQ